MLALRVLDDGRHGGLHRFAARLRRDESRVRAALVLGDSYDESFHSHARGVLTAATLIDVAWHFNDRVLGTERAYLVPLGS